MASGIEWLHRSSVKTGRRMKATHAAIPMSYKPKLDAVFDGRCTQTIRKGRKYAVGQRRWIFGWSGVPRHSKWGRRMLVEIVGCHGLKVRKDWIGFFPDERAIPQWASCWARNATELARLDFIDPPTGSALRDTLKRLNGRDWQGEYQVVRWKRLEEVKAEG